MYHLLFQQRDFAIYRLDTPTVTHEIFFVSAVILGGLFFLSKLFKRQNSQSYDDDDDAADDESYFHLTVTY